MNEVYTLWATAFAGASAFAALLTALISARALRQAERARKEASKPEVIVDALYEGSWAVLRIRNIGGGAARDIKFRASVDSLPHTFQNPGPYEVLKSKIFTEGLPYLAPKEDWYLPFSGLVGLPAEWLRQLGDSGVEITVRYWDDERSEKDPYTKVSVINPVVEMDAIDFQTREMRQFERFHKTVGKLVKPITDIAKYTKQIDNTLKDKGRVETAYAITLGGKVFAAGNGVNIPIGNVTEEAILGGHEYRTDQTDDVTFSSEKEAVQVLMKQAMWRGRVEEGNEGQAEKEKSEEKGDEPA